MSTTMSDTLCWPFAIGTDEESATLCSPFEGNSRSPEESEETASGNELITGSKAVAGLGSIDRFGGSWGSGSEAGCTKLRNKAVSAGRMPGDEAGGNVVIGPDT
jgi:hypothetical protein